MKMQKVINFSIPPAFIDESKKTWYNKTRIWMVKPMRKVEEILEISRIHEQIAQLTKTEMGKKKARELHFLSDYKTWEVAHLSLLEMTSLLFRFGRFPITQSRNLIDLLEYGEKCGIFTASELDQIAEDVLTIQHILAFYQHVEGDYPLISDMLSHVHNLASLESSIHRVISPNLTIYDHASSNLASIRFQLAKLEEERKKKIQQLSRLYAPYLSESNVTIRNGHQVFAVKSGEKGKVPGIVHDISQTGNTIFIEPSVVVEINNKIYEYQQKEYDEIQLILKTLTKEALLHKEEIAENNSIISELDFLTAKAQYGIDENASIASCSTRGVLSLKNARHPLLDKKTMVPNDFYLDDQTSIMIISGPNAGGKSIALKTVAMAVYMHQSGLPIWADEGAELPFYRHLFVDIGDAQSIDDSLSTFSAHMTKYIEITSHLGSKDLVILDELGTGTDPMEGEALAKAIVEYFHQKHAYAMVTSHFDGMKNYALEKPYIISASMRFDEQEFRPTYRLRLGTPGKSYGLEVSERLGLSKEIIAQAREYLKKDGKMKDAVDSLHVLVTKNEQLEEKLKEKEIELKKKESVLQEKEQKLNEKRERFLQDVEEEKEEMLLEAEAQIEDILTQVKKENLKMHEVIQARTNLRHLHTEEKEEEENHEPIAVNDFVTIKDMNLDGKVVRIRGNKASVHTTLGQIEVVLSRLIKGKTPEVAKPSPSSHFVDQEVFRKSVPLELNIIGYHVEEGLVEVEKYLDMARLRNLKEVRIIHGFGTGKLREAVWNYLKKQNFIESYRYGGAGEGGGGATVVRFK